MSEIPTVLSAAHKKVIKFLEKWGIELMEEVDFPPYRVDIFVPEVHVVIEVDGPHHSKKANEKRDKKLLEEYLLPTFRIDASDVRTSKNWEDALFLFFGEHAWTAVERWEECSIKVPWL